MINFHFILMVSLFIFGLNFATDYSEGENFKQNGHYNLLWKLKFWSLKYIGEYWTRPLLSCPVCQSSVWGTIFYFCYFPFELSINYFVIWIVSVFAIAGLNRIIKNFI